MKSATEYLTPDTFDSGKIASAIAQIKALPINAQDKVELLQAWATAVGAKVSRSQFQAVEVSGIDNL